AVLVVQHEEDAGPGRLAPVLGAAARLDVRRPDRGEPLPGDLAGHVGLVVLGGSMGATDDDVAPWLPATRRLLAAGVSDRAAWLRDGGPTLRAAGHDPAALAAPYTAAEPQLTALAQAHAGAFAAHLRRPSRPPS